MDTSLDADLVSTNIKLISEALACALYDYDASACLVQISFNDWSGIFRILSQLGLYPGSQTLIRSTKIVSCKKILAELGQIFVSS